MLKILKCSGEEDPCAACMKLALAISNSKLRALERKVLRWTDCIRTLLGDLGFFDEGKWRHCCYSNDILYITSMFQ